MINFKSKITKSIIIAIFILSLTISIYIVPASAIVTGTIDQASITQLFDQSNYQYFYSVNNGVESSPQETILFDQVLYPFYESNNQVDPSMVQSRLIGRRATDNYSSWNFTSGSSNYVRFTFPVGIYGAEQISMQLMILSSISYDDTVFYGLSNAIRFSRITLGCYLKDGTYVNITPNTFEYPGISEYSSYINDDGTNIHSYSAKVFDITLNNLDVSSLFITVYFQSSLDYRALSDIRWGVSKLTYTGANTQLTNIQESIDNAISEIIASGDAQKQLNDMLMTVSPDGQLIIDQVNNDVEDVEEGLDSIIQGITVPLPEPDQILPDHDDIMGQYMDSGGSEAVSSVFGPLFDENGPIFIMMFAVLSIALISYVLYGKKA